MTKKVRAKIKEKFDLGYILILEDGVEAQLRLPEQRGRELDLHINGLEEQIYGEEIDVYIIYRDEQYCSVSQYSSAERKERQRVENAKKVARENCKIGDICKIVIDTDYDWGYLCSEINGYLSGAIVKPCDRLNLRQKVKVRIVGKTKNGAPYFEIYNGESNA